MIKKFTQCVVALCSSLLLFTSEVNSQIPTNQDCLGAIPICGPIYTTPSSTFGMGNYPNEDNPNTCLSPGEYNSLWFIFTVITSGDLAFTTFPVNSGADYDWALYNLTNNGCLDIPTTNSMMVSCNSSQYGITGISASGIGNNNGPGPTNAFNYLYPVVAGETYVLNMNNWSGSTGGYTLDFSASSATIFDSVKPFIDTILPIACTDSTISFSFSENITCASVDDADFALTGPWGPYTLSNVTGSVCQAGGTQEINFTADVTPKIQHGGTYYFHLTNNAGSVTDLCSNVADPDSVAFYVNGVEAFIDSVLSPFCAGDNGVVFTSGNMGNLPYIFSLNSLTQSTGSFTGLDDTTYIITITDAGGCFDTAHVTLYPATGDVTAEIQQYTDALCFNSCDGTIIAGGTGGVTPYNYEWSTGAMTAGISGLCIGTYTVIVIDQSDCRDTISAVINQPPPLFFSLDSVRDASCFDYWDGYAKVSVSGGTPNYFYNWVPYGGNSPAASQLNANTYTVEIIDGHQCHYDTTFVVVQPDALVIHYPYDTTICDGTEALLHVDITGGTPGYNVVWNTGSTDNPLLVTTTIDSTLLVYATDDHGCTSPQEGYTVQVLHQPEVELGNDTTICNGDVLYKTFYSPSTLYLWQDGATFYDYSISKRGTYTIMAYNDCFAAYDTVTIDVDDCATCVKVPDAFTPNGDGINDEFSPIIGCTFTQYIFKIFTRWGELVYETTDPVNGWDGRNEGKFSETGTYVWELDYSGSQHAKSLDQQMTGYVVLIR